MELLPNATHHRLAVLECPWQPRCHSVVGARRPGIPTRPDEGIAAPESKAQSHVLCFFGIIGVRVARSVVEQVENHFPAAIGHVVDQDPARSPRLCRPEDKKVSYSTIPTSFRGALSRSAMTWFSGDSGLISPFAMPLIRM